jgi:hypothetical protein
LPTEFRVGLHAEGEGAIGWMRILAQEALPWDDVGGPDRPIILFSGRLPHWCHAFVERGGVAVVSGAGADDALFGPSVLATLHRFHPPEGDREAVMPGLARLFHGEGAGECRLHENRKARNGRLPDIHPAVLWRRHGEGWLIFTGLSLTEHLVASGDCLRTFTGISDMSERVASVDKAEVADTLVFMLKEAFFRLGLPYICLARYPAGAQSVFLFRVDVDGLFRSNCRRMAEVAKAHGIRGSFYFNASLCRTYPGEIAVEWLETHEIGHHADQHDLFDTVEENRANLLRGMDWVDEVLGVRPTGYVAPRGLWNSALDQAMAELGHAYSSDFSLDLDSMPFMTPAGVLQIPVHAFSAERYVIQQEDAGLAPPSAHAILEHYLSALRRQVRLGRPAHLYGHPEILGKMADEILGPLFETVTALTIPSMTVGDFAAWWLERSRVTMSFWVDALTGRMSVNASGWAVSAVARQATTVTVGETAIPLVAGCPTTLQSSGARGP